MLRIVEVDTKAKFDQLRANEDGKNNILYIRKYKSDMVLSDNNTALLNLTSDDTGEIDIDDMVSDLLDDIQELESGNNNNNV